MSRDNVAVGTYPEHWRRHVRRLPTGSIGRAHRKGRTHHGNNTRKCAEGAQLTQRDANETRARCIVKGCLIDRRVTRLLKLKFLVGDNKDHEWLISR